jgi:primosomal protein N'
MRCHYCGHPGIAEGMQICPNCGSDNPDPTTFGEIASSVCRVVASIIIGLMIYVVALAIFIFGLPK